MDKRRRMELGQVEVVSPIASSDLISEILSRLPAKSLMRCKCVRKSWSSLIRNPLFVKAHRNKRRSLNQNTTNLIFFKSKMTRDRNKIEHKYREYTYSHQLFATQLMTNDELGIVTTTPPIQLPTPPIYRCQRTMTPFQSTLVVSAGVVCHLDRFRDPQVLHILNPSTREVVPFPLLNKWPDATYVALGFTSLTNEYKLLHIRRTGFGRDQSVSFKFKVFTLGGTSSTWKDVPEMDYAHLGLVPEKIYFSKHYLCIHGAIHWVQYMNNYKERPLLLAFDVAEERFRVIPLPQDYTNNYSWWWNRVIEVNGHLALFDLNGLDSDTIMDFWIMKDYRNEVWLKERILFPNPWGKIGRPKPICSIHTGELLLSCRSGDEQHCFVHLYDMKLKTYKITDVVLPEGSELHAGGYEETISPLD